MRPTTKKAHGLEFKFITLTLFLLIALGTIKAQKQNDISLNAVMVSDSIDRTKYLWNLLNYNYQQSLKDTVLYYSIDFSTSIPDSNWSENFKGVIETEILDGKQTQYLSEGVYTETNSIRNFVKLNLGLDFFEYQKPKKYKKFKKNKILSLIRKDGFSTFVLFKKFRKSKDELTYKFSGRNLTRLKTSIVSSKSLLGYHLHKVNTDFNYQNLNKHQILKEGELSLEYSKKDLYVVINIKYKLLPAYKLKHKLKMQFETPESLQSLLQNVNNNSIE